MVKVVGQSQEFVKRITCTNCSSELEYTQNEVKELHTRDYGGGPDGKRWIDCPCCGKEVIIATW